MGMGLAFALRGAAQGLGTGLIEEAARKREDALRAAEQEREDRQRAEDRAWKLEDDARDRERELADRDEARSYDRAERQRAVQDLTGFIVGDEEQGYTLTGNAAVVGEEIMTGLSDPENGLGMTPEQVKGATDGALGNIYVESGFEPGAEGDTNLEDHAYNQGQWRGERYENLKRMAAEWGMEESDPRLAGKFFVWEVTGGDPHETAQFQKVLAEDPQTPEEWAEALARHYWRPAEPGNPERQRAAAAFASVAVDGNLDSGTLRDIAEDRGIIPEEADPADIDEEWRFEDTDGDGVADQKRLYRRGSDGDWAKTEDTQPAVRNGIGDDDEPKAWADRDDSDILDEVGDRMEDRFEAWAEGDFPMEFQDQLPAIRETANEMVLELVRGGKSPGEAWREVRTAIEEDLRDNGQYDGAATTEDDSATTDQESADSGAGVPSPTNQAEYEALPPGTKYQHPDDPPGTLRTKG